MGDIYCARCGEPWDAYGVRNGDMEKREAKRFLKGEGCPSCNFGENCSSCDGTGIDYVDYSKCTTCRDKGYVLAWSPQSSVGPYRAGQLYTGYLPNVRKIEESVHDNPVKLGVRTFPEKFDRHQTRDGWVEDWWVQCPEGCATKEHSPCTSCDGAGTLTPPDEDLELKAAKSEINASDEDAVDILVRRGLI